MVILYYTKRLNLLIISFLFQIDLFFFYLFVIKIIVQYFTIIIKLGIRNVFTLEIRIKL